MLIITAIIITRSGAMAASGGFATNMSNASTIAIGRDGNDAARTCAAHSASGVSSYLSSYVSSCFASYFSRASIADAPAARGARRAASPPRRGATTTGRQSARLG